MGSLLQITGLMLSLASFVWLSARLIAPHDMSRLEAVSIFLPAVVIGLILVWVGRRMR
jgi:hypothetical protein